MISAAEVVLRCVDIDPTLVFLTEKLGFSVVSVFPADDPVEVVVSGHGLRVCLRRDPDAHARGGGCTLRLRCDDPQQLGGGAAALVAPNGTTIELIGSAMTPEVPAPASTFTLTHARDDATWGSGRAGMLYRDLVPGRQGGFVIASHIVIPDGGPVPDYVHFHRVQFQMIYCRRGWVRVVYEDQGPPFVMNAGDCVLQPPQIRHRVLESSAGLEVIEVGTPALHETLSDHAMTLPTSEDRPDREFCGQRFVLHRADAAAWRPWRLDGFEARDTGIGTATNGLAEVHVARVAGRPVKQEVSHEHDFHLVVVLAGTATLGMVRHEHDVSDGDAFTLPRGQAHTLSACSQDFEILEVVMRSAVHRPGAPISRTAQ